MRYEAWLVSMKRGGSIKRSIPILWFICIVIALKCKCQSFKIDRTSMNAAKCWSKALQKAFLMIWMETEDLHGSHIRSKIWVNCWDSESWRTKVAEQDLDASRRQYVAFDSRPDMEINATSPSLRQIIPLRTSDRPSLPTMRDPESTWLVVYIRW